MNLVQLAEHAKNLSNQQLQQMLQRPDGAVPPFILAAEAARRQDIERSAQVQPAQPSTVLDDLIQSRAEKSGVNQLAGQMATQQPPQAPQAPQQPPQMASGGSVRRFVDGSIVNASDTSTFMGVPYDPSQDAFGGFPGLWSGIASSWNYATTPWSQKYGPEAKEEERAKPFFSNAAAKGDREGVNALVSNDYAQDTRDGSVSVKPKSVIPGTTKPVDPAAADKQQQTADKEKEMGVTNPSTNATPTTGNPADEDSIRARLQAFYGDKGSEYILGLSPTSYAAASQAMLDSTPGTTSAERWSNLAMAMAQGQEQVDQDRAEREREGAMALLNWDMKKADQAHEDQVREMGWDREDERYNRQLAVQAANERKAQANATRSAQLEGIKTQSETYKVMADRAGKDMENISSKYQGNPLGIKAWTPEDVEAYKRLQAAQQSYYSQYIYFQKQLSSANGINLDVKETIDPVTGRPIPMQP